MEIQSLSVVVPGGCPNNCKFCVAKMHEQKYVNQIEQNHRFTDLYKKDFKKRLLFARDNGCNTVMLTGDGEPLVNRSFLANFGEWNDNLPNPFRWIEVQTSGVLLDDEYLRFLRNTVGVNTISLSLSNMFDGICNQEYNGIPENLFFNIDYLCKEIKRYDFNLRLSLNLTDAYNNKTSEQIFARAKELGADQITFRILYTSPANNTLQDKWIAEHRCSDKKVSEIDTYIKGYELDYDVGQIGHGKPLEKLPFGAVKYSVDEMSVVIDDNCMSTGVVNTLKYLILRPDCHLYSRWDDKGSLIF
jgi:sulfatase maturation enzyme AslB (radical SAM superfamily)